MDVTEKLIKPLTEAKYLNADNADRYRSIMRIFFENYGGGLTRNFGILIKFIFIFFV